MSLGENEIFRNLEFEWMKYTGRSCSCKQIIHPGISCFQEAFVKFRTVFKSVSKFYLVFHLIPLMFKLKKIIREKRVLATLSKTILQYMGSLIFMTHLVCGIKSSMCVISNLNLKIEETTIFGALPISGISIFWQSKSRREQIAYYVFARSIRAVYMMLLRRNIIAFQVPVQLFFIMFFGFLSYLFMEKRQKVKYSNILEGLWGEI